MNQGAAKKIRLHKYNRLAVLFAPDGYADTLGEGVSVSLSDKPFDCCLAFCFSLPAMAEMVLKAAPEAWISPGGVLFLAYPKAKNKQYPGIGRDDTFPALHIDPDGDGRVPDTDFFFHQMVSLDETFTLIGLQNRAGQKVKTPQKSQRVSEYEVLVPVLEEMLADKPDALSFFQSLTPGYRRGWARYVFSPVKKETQDAHLETMKVLLVSGVKSIDLA